MKKEFCTKLEIMFLCFYFFMKKLYKWSYIIFFKKLIIIEYLGTKLSQEREMHHLSLRRHLDKNMRQHLLKRISITHRRVAWMAIKHEDLCSFVSAVTCDIMNFSSAYEFFVLFTLMNFLCVQHTLVFFFGQGSSVSLFCLPWN